jgi:hypothetical protein
MWAGHLHCSLKLGSLPSIDRLHKISFTSHGSHFQVSRDTKNYVMLCAVGTVFALQEPLILMEHRPVAGSRAGCDLTQTGEAHP